MDQKQASAPRRGSYIMIGLSLVLLMVCYSRAISGMINQWMTDEDMGHGFAVPFVMAFIVWFTRNQWQGLKAEPSAWGFLFLAMGAGMQFLSVLGTGLFVGSVGFLISLFGLVVCFGGFPYVKAWGFPLVLGLFMLPKLAVVYNQTTLPMQLLASRMAAGMLTVSGFGVIREGNILDVGGHRVMVAEACSGIRYLLPLAFMAVLIAYFADRRVWMRAVMAALAMPLAILANAVRVAASAAVPTLAEGTPHEMIGLVIFVACLAMLMLCAKWLSSPERGAHA
jgi:exosortase